MFSEAVNYSSGRENVLDQHQSKEIGRYITANRKKNLVLHSLLHNRCKFCINSFSSTGCRNCCLPVSDTLKPLLSPEPSLRSTLSPWPDMRLALAQSQYILLKHSRQIYWFLRLLALRMLKFCPFENSDQSGSYIEVAPRALFSIQILSALCLPQTQILVTWTSQALSPLSLANIWRLSSNIQG